MNIDLNAMIGNGKIDLWLVAVIAIGFMALQRFFPGLMNKKPDSTPNPAPNPSLPDPPLIPTIPDLSKYPLLNILSLFLGRVLRGEKIPTGDPMRTQAINQIGILVTETDPSIGKELAEWLKDVIKKDEK